MADLSLLASRVDNIRAYFKQHLNLEPADENRMYISYLVSRSQEGELISFLARLEKDQVCVGWLQ
jgi:hypothetical protein